MHMNVAFGLFIVQPLNKQQQRTVKPITQIAAQLVPALPAAVLGVICFRQ